MRLYVPIYVHLCVHGARVRLQFVCVMIYENITKLLKKKIIKVS